MILKYMIKSKDNYTNLKEFLKIHFQISDRLLIKLKKNKKIFVNNNIASVSMPLNIGDQISVYIDFEEDNTNIIPICMTLDIVY